MMELGLLGYSFLADMHTTYKKKHASTKVMDKANHTAYT